MNLIVVGTSYRTAGVELLERLSIAPAYRADVLRELVAGPHVAEVVALSTCNRVEFYAAVPAFHAGLHQIAGALAEVAGVETADLADSLYVHHGEAAVAHTFAVAAGLDSMVVGEQQILGQLRDAYALAAETETAGALLHELFQQALRVGKRAHAETGIDQAPRSMVTAALAQAAALDASGSLAGRRAVVVGAGAMGSLAVSGLTRAGIGTLTVVNRSDDRADRLASAYAVTSAPMQALPALVAEADIVISATTSMAYVVTPELLGTARPILVDLAVPRDVHPDVKALGLTVIDVEHLAGSAAEHGHAAPVVAEAQAIVDAEVANFLAWQRGSQVAPTVAALRARAEDLVTAELARLARRSDLTDEQRGEVAHSMRRIVQRLLHEPTVRVRQLAAGPGGEAYPQLLRELFDLEVPGQSRVDQVADIATPERAA
ncbi:glutamyl-tRNA reductase [Hamadaea tsunoensis]|uniref:glutamyl-tRNA reductase n=1 Tax=Hamadaea tsunoensis TaxID=53368 RepID=UPI0003FEA2DB|nr:glutamyl-tRNA reductase [Hamadaea tsunoensis]